MKIKKSIVEAKWIKYPDDEEVEFKIRPFPQSEGLMPSDDEYKQAQFNWKVFNYCVLDWKGMVNEDNEPLECNEINKKFVFDYVREVFSFVIINAISSTKGIIEKKIL
jgi:hypothetical protein